MSISISRIMPLIALMAAIRCDVSSHASQNATDQSKEDERAVDAKWLERLSKEDRAALDEVVGFAPPAFPTDLRWLSGQPMNWGQLRGKVVVIQSFTTANAGGRGWPARVVNTLKESISKDLVIIALHTPEKAEAAEDFLKRQTPPPDVNVAIDADGAFCDALGVFKHPVNLVIDRNGAVRYAGLNPNGLKSAVSQLLAETYDAKQTPKERPKEKVEETPEKKGAEFPPIRGSVSGALDLRGKRGPDFAADQWHTDQPNAANKVVVLTFWNSDNASSIGAHSILNEIAERFVNTVTVVALTSESRSKVEENLARKRIDRSDIRYGLAIDRAGRTAAAMNISQVPHSVVLSSDWIVRWQGTPSQLTQTVLQQVIDADAEQQIANNKGRGQQREKKRGWKNQ